VQRIGGWPAQLIQPRFTVETFAIDHQSVPIPLAGRVTHPGWVVVRRQLTAIQEDLPPESERFVDDHYKSRCLNNLPRRRSGTDLRHTLGQAIRVRVLSRMRSVGALIEHRLGPRLERHFLLEV